MKYLIAMLLGVMLRGASFATYRPIPDDQKIIDKATTLINTFSDKKIVTIQSKIDALLLTLSNDKESRIYYIITSLSNIIDSLIEEQIQKPDWIITNIQPANGDNMVGNTAITKKGDVYEFYVTIKNDGTGIFDMEKLYDETYYLHNFHPIKLHCSYNREGGSETFDIGNLLFEISPQDPSTFVNLDPGKPLIIFASIPSITPGGPTKTMNEIGKKQITCNIHYGRPDKHAILESDTSNNTKSFYLEVVE